jgi:hypothetical protein
LEIIGRGQPDFRRIWYKIAFFEAELGAKNGRFSTRKTMPNAKTAATGGSCGFIRIFDY